MDNYNRKKAIELLNKAKKRDAKKIANKTHKWVRIADGMKLVKIN